MAAPTCTLYTGSNSASTNINDGTTYTILEADMGNDVKTWDEYRSYSGSVAQYNVTDANLIPVRILLRVKGTSASDLRSKIATISGRIDGITAGTTHLVYDGTTYHLMTSPLPTYTEDAKFHAGFWTDVTLELYRNTDVA